MPFNLLLTLPHLLLKSILCILFGCILKMYVQRFFNGKLYTLSTWTLTISVTTTSKTERGYEKVR